MSSYQFSRFASVTQQSRASCLPSSLSPICWYAPCYQHGKFLTQEFKRESLENFLDWMCQGGPNIKLLGLLWIWGFPKRCREDKGDDCILPMDCSLKLHRSLQAGHKVKFLIDHIVYLNICNRSYCGSWYRLRF